MQGVHRLGGIVATATAAAVIGFAVPAVAQVFVVREDSPIRSLSPAQVRDIYFGRLTLWGGVVEPTLLRPVFNRGEAGPAFFELLGESEIRFQRYWMKMTLSGKARPPKAVKDGAAVLATIRKDKSAIGFVAQPPSVPGVRVVPVVP